MNSYRNIKLSPVSGFDWDKGNANKNRLKHNVDTTECEEVFFNEPRIVFEDSKHSYREKRYRILGISSSGRRLSLAITVRESKIRVIMARDQSRKERNFFETETKNSKVAKE